MRIIKGCKAVIAGIIVLSLLFLFGVSWSFILFLLLFTEMKATNKVQKIEEEETSDIPSSSSKDTEKKNKPSLLDVVSDLSKGIVLNVKLS